MDVRADMSQIENLYGNRTFPQFKSVLMKLLTLWSAYSMQLFTSPSNGDDATTIISIGQGSEG